MFEKHNLKQGNIVIAFSDKKVSIGTLEISPKKELAKHNRPVLESLFQIKGKCLIKLFSEEGRTKEVILKQGESLDIAPYKYHIHSNPFDSSSITLWKANGDITKIINDIRKSSEM